MPKEKILNAKEMNLFVIDKLKDALVSFCDDNNDSRVLNENYSIEKLQMPNKVDGVYIQFAGTKDKSGLLKYVRINMMQVYYK